jgi:hypothetical protein
LFDPAGSVNTLLSRAGQSSTTAVDLAIKMGNTERLRIDSSGNVGIGVTSPGQLLHLSANGGTNIQVNSRAFFGSQYSDHFAVIGSAVRVDTGQTTGMVSTETNSGNGAPSAIRFGAGAIQFHSAASGTAGAAFNSERARIDSSGRLLLGTTTAGQASADDFTIADSGDVGITLRSTSSNQTQISFSDGTSGDAEYRGQIAYDHSDDHMRFRTGAVERMRIDSSGRVGIGTSSPSANLHLVGPIPYASGPTSLSEVVTKSAFRMQGSNNATSSIYFGVEPSNANQYLQVSNSSGTTADPLVLQPFGGRVGIGRTSPSERLDVNGKALFGQVKIGSNLVGTTTDLELTANSVILAQADQVK